MLNLSLIKTFTTVENQVLSNPDKIKYLFKINFVRPLLKLYRNFDSCLFMSFLILNLHLLVTKIMV